MKDTDLIEAAKNIKNNAYAPYSGLRVGAALLTGDGRVYTGVNVENASFGATNCAERSAIFSAVSDGCRNITAIAVNSDNEDYIYPCGICRQVISEFGENNTRIICTNRAGESKTLTLNELLPEKFIKPGKPTV